MTVDPLADPDRPHMARGTHMLGGMSIVVTPHLPKHHIGDSIAPKPWLVRWLLRWVPRRWRAPWYRVGARIDEDQFIVAAGKLFCTPATYAALLASMKGRKS